MVRRPLPWKRQAMGSLHFTPTAAPLPLPSRKLLRLTAKVLFPACPGSKGTCQEVVCCLWNVILVCSGPRLAFEPFTRNPFRRCHHRTPATMPIHATTLQESTDAGTDVDAKVRGDGLQLVSIQEEEVVPAWLKRGNGAVRRRHYLP